MPRRWKLSQVPILAFDSGNPNPGIPENLVSVGEGPAHHKQASEQVGLGTSK